MNILGIYDAHDASASLIIDGKIVAVAGEERFSRLKADVDYPQKSIEFCLSQAGISAGELDYVAIAGDVVGPMHNVVKRAALFDLDDWIKEQTDFWWPKFYEDKKLSNFDYYNIFKSNPKFSDLKSNYNLDELLSCLKYDNITEIAKCFKEIRIKKITEHLGIKRDKILFVKHEDAHVYYAYFANPKRVDTLIFTGESRGEYSNGTVSKVVNNKIQELSHTDDNHIGHLYKFVTLLLGMKPDQHEYKTMGLAPYSNKRELERSYEVFKDLFKIDGYSITFNKKPKDIYFEFKERLHGHRFDGIAGALQKVCEDTMAMWVEAVIGKTGISNVLFSGGVAQNIKICKVLAEHPKVDYFFVNPISGDGSLSVGAAYCAMAKYCDNQKIDKKIIKPLTNIYLGPAYNKDEINNSIQKNKLGEQFLLYDKEITPAWIADQLINQKIIARFSGRMEYGQRALGNRSIIADPRNPMIVTRLNEKIKHRDFWMPFTPSILHDKADSFIKNPRNIYSPFMTIAFDGTNFSKENIPAALHMGDFTVRPQMLKREDNPFYYDIIDEFSKKTGVAALLNTSFNLHGDPVVCNPQDAIYTFLNSELDILLFDHVAILRK